MMETKFLAIAAGVLLQAGMGVWWLASLNSRVSHNAYQIQMVREKVHHNSRFVQDWPSGKWGSGALPSDVKQDLLLLQVQKDIDKLMGKIYNGE